MIQNPCCGVNIKLAATFMALMDIFIAATYVTLDIFRLSTILTLKDQEGYLSSIYLLDNPGAFPPPQPTPSPGSVQDAFRPPVYNTPSIYIMSISSAIILRLLVIIPLSILFILSLDREDGKIWKVKWILWWLLVNSCWSTTYVIYYFLMWEDRSFMKMDVINCFSGIWILYKAYQVFIVFLLHHALEMTKKLTEQLQIASQPIEDNPNPDAEAANPAKSEHSQK